MYLLRSRTGLRAFTQLYHSPALSANAESATLLSAGVSEVPAVLRGFAQQVSFPLAQTGEGISECELVAWAVKPGDVVGPFDKLCDVQSDKAAIEITSRYGGKVLTLHHAVGSMVKVGAPLVDIEVPDDVQVAPEHLAAAAPAAVTAATPTSGAPAANATRPPPPTAVTVTATKVAVQVATATTPPPEEEAPGRPPASAAASAVAAAAAAARPVVEEPPSVRGRPQASPAVRAYARELGVDLAEVEGTGPGGRVTRADVASYIDQLQRRGSPSAAAEDEEEMGMVLQANDFLSPIGASAAHEAAAAAAAAAGAAAGGAGGPRFRSRGRSPEELLSQYRRMGAAAATAAVAAQEGSQVVPLRGYRRAMVASMTAAAAVPVFHFHDEVAMDRLLSAREAMRADPLLRTGGGGGMGAASGGAAAAAGGGGALRLTVLPLILKALSAALNVHPHLNASLAPGGTELLLHQHHNIGVAMATPTGLVVPNIKQVERKSVAAVAAELHLLQQLAAAGRLPPEALSGGTITISNIGTIGGTYATPLVSPPEVAIVALGRLQLMPRYSTIVNTSSSSSIRPPAPAGASGPAVSGASAVRGWGGWGGGGGRVGCEGSGAAAVPLPVPVSVMPVSWGADHRVVDGAALAAFSNTWREFLEAPERLLLHLA